MKKAAKSKSSSNTFKILPSNAVFLLGLGSVAFCWLYGITGLVLAFFSIKHWLRLRKKFSHPKPLTKTRMQWALRLAIAGAFLSLIFTIYYITSLAKGAFIRLF